MEESFVEPDSDLMSAMAGLAEEGVDPVPVPEQPQETLEDAFPDEMYDDLTGLMWLGYLSTSFDYAGHLFRIKTLTVGEELAVAQVVKEYMDTMGVEKAMAAGLVAACVETVDGRQLRGRLGPSDTQTIRDKFEYITDSETGWYWPTVEAVYTKYVELQVRQTAVYERLQSK